jgi:hypothetical protein
LDFKSVISAEAFEKRLSVLLFEGYQLDSHPSLVFNEIIVENFPSSIFTPEGLKSLLTQEDLQTLIRSQLLIELKSTVIKLQADPNLSQLPFLNINSPLDFDL